MNKKIDIVMNEEEPTPEWVFELQQQFREDLTKFQAEFSGISEELNEIKVGIKAVNEVIKSSNELMASAKERLTSANELMASAKEHWTSAHTSLASSNARIESASLEKQIALKKMNEIEKKIEETKAVRAETDQYWNDLINKEIEKRNKCLRHRSRQSSCSKLSAKRLSNNDEEHKQSKAKKRLKL
ncbi:unnamed protein product [Rotaria magnacalcarata]|uniref:Uncharacterized protein n=1 Tax=Rotaria magnacalcarata TaxID=392030 RepID=A0A816MB25_9BILA|nr:unnamed protein product [Rotaria magnacalcarata]